MQTIKTPGTLLRGSFFFLCIVTHFVFYVSHKLQLNDPLYTINNKKKKKLVDCFHLHDLQSLPGQC